MGYASAIAYILLAFVGAITILNFMAKKYWVKYQY
jgi:multiple sugar transport system permease protein